MDRNPLLDQPLKIRVLWKPTYDILYPEDAGTLYREPFSLDTYMATTGGLGDWLYGVISQSPQLVHAPPEVSANASKHEVLSLWADLLEKAWNKPTQRKKFQETMERACLIARGLRKEGIA